MQETTDRATAAIHKRTLYPLLDFVERAASVRSGLSKLEGTADERCGCCKVDDRYTELQKA